MKGTQINYQAISRSQRYTSPSCHTTTVKDTVYIHPHIIITSEFENLSSLVSESEVSLETVSVVVLYSFAVRTVVSPSNVVKGEEGEVGVLIDPGSNVSQGYTEDGVHGLFGVVEPLVETIGRLNVLPRTPSRVRIHGCPVSSNITTLATAPSIAIVTLLAYQSCPNV